MKISNNKRCQNKDIKAIIKKIENETYDSFSCSYDEYKEKNKSLYDDVYDGDEFVAPVEFHDDGCSCELCQREEFAHWWNTQLEDFVEDDDVKKILV